MIESKNMKHDEFYLGVKALIKNKANKLLLLKVKPIKMPEPYWDIPGGRIQKGSTVEETLKREIEEETGITSVTSYEPFLMVLSNIRIPLSDTESVGLILSAYICQVENYDNIKISEEHTEAKWFSPEEASELLAIKYPKNFCEKIARNQK